MSRATMSRDGVPRITLRVGTRLGLDDMALAIALASYEDADIIATAGRARLLRWARDGVRQFGLDHLRMGDTDGYEDEIAAARKRLVEVGIFADAAAAVPEVEIVDGRHVPTLR